jgi:hypothetical protein
MQTNIHVFKTNINTLAQLKKADAILSHSASVKKWNIDIDDCDKVLTIETSSLDMEMIIFNMKAEYIYCERME